MTQPPSVSWLIIPRISRFVIIFVKPELRGLQNCSRESTQFVKFSYANWEKKSAEFRKNGKIFHIHILDNNLTKITSTFFLRKCWHMSSDILPSLEFTAIFQHAARESACHVIPHFRQVKQDRAEFVATRCIHISTPYAEEFAVDVILTLTETIPHAQHHNSERRGLLCRKKTWNTLYTKEGPWQIYSLILYQEPHSVFIPHVRAPTSRDCGSWHGGVPPGSPSSLGQGDAAPPAPELPCCPPSPESGPPRGPCGLCF